MSDPKEKLPAHDKTQAEKLKDEGMFDPLELVSRGGYVGNPREIIENPGVAPEMPELPEDFHDDLLAHSEDEP